MKCWRARPPFPASPPSSAALSGLAFLIAVVGVYGLLAYTVARRVPEFGIRLTLGASPAQFHALLLRQAMLRVLAGVAAGLLGAWWLARLMESLLFGVRPHDPATFMAVGGLLVLASLAAVLVPTRRAMKIDSHCFARGVTASFATLKPAILTANAHAQKPDCCHRGPPRGRHPRDHVSLHAPDHLGRLDFRASLEGYARAGIRFVEVIPPHVDEVREDRRAARPPSGSLRIWV